MCKQKTNCKQSRRPIRSQHFGRFFSAKLEPCSWLCSTSMVWHTTDKIGRFYRPSVIGLSWRGATLTNSFSEIFKNIARSHIKLKLHSLDYISVAKVWGGLRGRVCLVNTTCDKLDNWSHVLKTGYRLKICLLVYHLTSLQLLPKLHVTKPDCHLQQTFLQSFYGRHPFRHTEGWKFA